MNTFIFISVLLTFFAVYGLLNFFTAKGIFNLIKTKFEKINAKIFGIVYACIALMPILSFVPLGTFLSGIVSWIGFHWFGLFVYLLLYFLTAELIIFILRFIVKDEKLKKAKIIAGLTALSLGCVTFGYGLYNAATPQTTSYKIDIDSKSNDELNIVLVTDIHLGALGAEDRIPEMVKQINEINPDIVCLSGDIFDGDITKIDNPDQVAKYFNQIKTKHGVYACLGNHDAGKTFGDMVDFIKQCNITLLNEEHKVIDDKFVIVGRLDRSPIGGSDTLKRKDTESVLKEIDKYDLPVIVMDHNPTNIDQYDSRADLILCGHTHRGQLFPASIVTELMYDVDYGYYRKDSKSPQVIVSSGIGTWGMPVKVGAKSEIVNIKIS